MSAQKGMSVSLMSAVAAADPPSLVTKVTEDVELIAKEDCNSCVLLKEVSRGMESTPSGPKLIAYYKWWVLAGRHGIISVTIPYDHDASLVLRVDVPDGVRLSSDYLELQLANFWKNSGGLPPDTVIIKG